MATVVDQLRAIGRADSRVATGPVCPTAVGYFSVGTRSRNRIGDAVRRATAPGPCCPPTMPQRNILSSAGVAFVVCCAGEAWAILPKGYTPAQYEPAGAWLRRLAGTAPVVCTLIVPAGEPAPEDWPALAPLRAAMGPRVLPQRAFTTGGFLRRPVARPTQGAYMASCVVNGVNYSRTSRAGPVDAPDICRVPLTPSQFAETAWCANYAQTHGAIGTQQCTNAAIGIKPQTGGPVTPPATGPFCKDGRDMVSCVTQVSGGLPGTEAYATEGPIKYANHVLMFPGGTLQDHTAEAQAFLDRECGPDANKTLWFTWAGQRVDIRKRGTSSLMNCGSVVKVIYGRDFTLAEATQFFYDNCAPKTAGTWSDFTPAQRQALYQQAAPPVKPTLRPQAYRPPGPLRAAPAPVYQGPTLSPTSPTVAPPVVCSTSCGVGGAFRQIIWDHCPTQAELAAWGNANCRYH